MNDIRLFLSINKQYQHQIPLINVNSEIMRIENRGILNLEVGMIFLKGQ